VFDDASYLLTTRFYEELLDGNGGERQPPAAALRAAQSWLRQVTFGELRGTYEVGQAGMEQYLLIGQPRSTASAAAPSRAPRGYELLSMSRSGVGYPVPTAAGQPIRLRLGADAERPFASPHEWAAFTATGA
jgi:CHAT domain-containing protein